jgi:hypothetical protein
MEYWNDGRMDYWSDGRMEYWNIGFLNAVLHYSTIPPLQSVVKENPSADGGGVVGWEDKLAATSV